jgi:hypothetical protein
LNSNADEAYAISMTIKSLLQSNDIANTSANILHDATSSSFSSTYSPPRSIAVFCKSNASASELGARLQNDLSQVANVYATNKYEALSVGGEYKVMPGLMPYAEFTSFDYTTPDANVRTNKGSVVLAGVKLNF